MTITQEFVYRAPTTIAGVLDELEAGGPRAHLLAGGTDLVAWLRDDAIDADVVIDLKGVDELRGLHVEGPLLWIGALVTFNELALSPVVGEQQPLVAELAGMVASVGIRNRATLVGNICSAVPSCDAGPVLLALDARIHTIGPRGSRVVPITDWFVAPRRTALASGEAVEAVSIPAPPAPTGAAFARLTRYRGEDLAQASVAVTARGDGSFRVAFGAVAPTPIRASEVERELEHRDGSIERGLVHSMVRDSIAPITDLRSTAEYRAAMTEVMFERSVRVALDRRSGTGPPYGTRLI